MGDAPIITVAAAALVEATEVGVVSCVKLDLGGEADCVTAAEVAAADDAALPLMDGVVEAVWLVAGTTRVFVGEAVVLTVSELEAVADTEVEAVRERVAETP